MKTPKRTIYVRMILIAIIIVGILLLIPLSEQDKPGAGENTAQVEKETKSIALEQADPEAKTPETGNPETAYGAGMKASEISDNTEIRAREAADDQEARIPETMESTETREPETTEAMGTKELETSEDAETMYPEAAEVPETKNPETDGDTGNKDPDTASATATKNPETANDTEIRSEDTDSGTNHDWVENLPAAQTENQIMVVAATGSSARLSLHNKESDGSWKEIFSTNASIGKNGIGKSKEGDHKTPRGSYRFTMGFGLKQPGSVNLPYTRVDSNCFWVDDPASKYYNKFVSLGSVEKDWNSAESLAGSGSSYNYALAINYNAECVPGKGSAIFLHCLPTGGAGCIAVSEDAMVRILKETTPNCLLIIDSATEMGAK